MANQLNTYQTNEMDELSLEVLRERFKPYDVRHNPEKYHLDYPPGLFRKASVLIALFYRDNDYHVILTVRSKDLTHHAGYVAFPGGMRDDDDEDEIHTALREAEEEIGLDPKLVDIICVGGPGIVSPNSLVYPVISLVKPDFKLKLNEKEVSMVFDLPLSRFLSRERLRINKFNGDDGTVYHPHHFIDHVNNGEEVDTWGFTASLCIAAALVLYQSDEKFNIYNDDEMTKDSVFQMKNVRRILAKYKEVSSAKL